jgi:excisionase family DNA binding protein
MDKLYTTHDVARLIQVDPSTVSKWIDKGILVAYRTPGRHRRVQARHLRDFLVAHQMPVPEELGGGLAKLLVVDDEKPALDAIKRAFKPFASQVEVLTTTSGVEALLLVAEERPHGLLIDLNLPDADGLEVVQRVRSRKQLDGVACVTMTSKRTLDAVEKSQKAGAVACLAKPIDAARVLELFKVPLAMTAKR